MAKMATLPIPTVSIGGIGTRIVPKAGTFNLTLRPALKQPSTMGYLQQPYFYGAELTGCLFGAAGYYRAIPSWRTGPNGVSAPYQFGGFSVNAGYSYDLKALLSNPLQYSAAPSYPNYWQAIGTPYDNGFQQPSGSMAPGNLFVNNYGLNVDATFSKAFAKYSIPVPNLPTSDQTFPFSSSQSLEWAAAGYGCNGSPVVEQLGITPPSFLYLAPDGSGLKYGCNFGGTVVGVNFTPCGSGTSGGSTYGYLGIEQEFVYYDTTGNIVSNPYDNNNPHSSFAKPKLYISSNPFSLYKAIWNGLLALNSYTNVNLAKVHAGTGNFLRGYQQDLPVAGNMWYGGNIYCDVAIDQNNNPLTILVNGGFTVSLSDTTDNGLFQSSSASSSTNVSIQQIPGGGFLVFDFENYNNILFLIMPDFSEYWRINVAGISGWYLHPREGNLTFDASGFLNYLAYSFTTFSELLYSGPGKPTIYLPGGKALSPISSWATICRNAEKCDEPWEG